MLTRGRSDARILLTQDVLDQIHAINVGINQQITYAFDKDVHGAPDFWTDPRFNTGTFRDPVTGKMIPRRNHGDCEDYAIAKRNELIAKLGLNPGALLMANVHTDRGISTDHAVLMLRGVMPDGREVDVALDNRNDYLALWHETGYHFTAVESPHDPKVFLAATGSHQVIRNTPRGYLSTSVSQVDQTTDPSFSSGSGGMLFLDPPKGKNPIVPSEAGLLMSISGSVRIFATNTQSENRVDFHQPIAGKRTSEWWSSSEILFGISRDKSQAPAGTELPSNVYRLEYIDHNGRWHRIEDVKTDQAQAGLSVILPTDPKARAEMTEFLRGYHEAMKRAGVHIVKPDGSPPDLTSLPSPEDLRLLANTTFKAPAEPERSQEQAPDGPPRLIVPPDKGGQQVAPPR